MNSQPQLDVLVAGDLFLDLVLSGFGSGLGLAKKLSRRSFTRKWEAAPPLLRAGLQNSDSVRVSWGRSVKRMDGGCWIS